MAGSDVGGFIVALATYDGAVAGWKCSNSVAKLVFAFSAHDKPVRAITIDSKKGKTMITAGGDEMLK